MNGIIGGTKPLMLRISPATVIRWQGGWPDLRHGHSARFNLNTLGARLDELHERLAGVVIECLDFEEFLHRYDRPTTLFYLDPPYHGTEGYYGKGMFSREDFARLARALAELKGSFLLSINDCPEIRTTFKDFYFEEIDTTYTVRGQGTATSARELLVSNHKVKFSRTRA